MRGRVIDDSTNIPGPLSPMSCKYSDVSGPNLFGMRNKWVGHPLFTTLSSISDASFGNQSETITVTNVI